MIKKHIVIICLLLLQVQILTFSQNGEKPEIKLSADFVNTYAWRGLALSALPNIQPALSLEFKGFALGAWASTDFIGEYREYDLFASYNYKFLTLTVYDYYTESKYYDYFGFESDKTGHTLDFFVTIEGGEKYPFDLTFSTLFYGNDPKWDKTTNTANRQENNYSIYTEAGYTIKLGENSLRPYVAATPFDSQYGDGLGNKTGFAIVNTGIVGEREVKITETFSLPFKATLASNLQAKTIFFILSITIK